MELRGKKILVVDDEQRIRDLLTRFFVELGFVVRWASSAQEATNVIIREDVDLVLLDIKMSQVDGKTMFEVIQEYNPEMKVIIISVYPIDKQKQLIPQARDYYDKSQGLWHLLKKVNHALVNQN